METKKGQSEKDSLTARKSVDLHDFYRGKMETSLKCRVRDFSDFALWYTPGVAAPCLEIAHDKKKAYDYTCKWNTVAIVSDGSRVLGLGDIGPEAAMPVMEGKALLFKYLGGVDAVSLCLDTKDEEEIIKTVKNIQPSFGGINLEDIESPKCFSILERLRKECRIPVWHDDQQGTACVTLAALINALKVVGKRINQVKITMVGAGAANIRIASLVIAYGADPKNIIILDSRGSLHRGRKDIKTNPEKRRMAKLTNGKDLATDIPGAMKDSDVLIALSVPGPGRIKSEWVRSMAENSIVFACANPVPEIWPDEALSAGAAIVATGRSDFPNQVNNSLCFPGIFRGVLDVRARTITDSMCIAAAVETAKVAAEKGLSEKCIIPKMDETDLFAREAVAVGMTAIKEGNAGILMSREKLYKAASDIISRSRKETELKMKTGLIQRCHSCEGRNL